MRLLPLLMLPFAAAAQAADRPAPAHAAVRGESARYVCDDGTVAEVLYGGGAAVLTVDGRTIEMARTGEDAARFAGGGAQWTVAGPREGVLTGRAASATRCRAG